MMRFSLISKAILFILSLSFSIFIGTAGIQAASSHPFYWEKIDVDLQLIESGDLLVTETQKYVFTAPYTNQRTRYIQLDRIDKIQDITVTENNLPVINLRTSVADKRQYISWEHPQITKFPESHTFVLKYRAVGALEVGNDRTQFNWMAIFPDRKAVVNSAQIRLQVPVKLSELTKNFTTSGVGVTINNVNPTTIDFSSKGSIEPQAKLQILGELPSTVIKQPSVDNGWRHWLSTLVGWIFNLFKFIGIAIAIPCIFFFVGLFIDGTFNSGSRGGGGGGGCGGDGGDGGGCGGCGGGD